LQTTALQRWSACPAPKSQDKIGIILSSQIFGENKILISQSKWD
jgi:hypothetical protein